MISLRTIRLHLLILSFHYRIKCFFSPPLFPSMEKYTSLYSSHVAVAPVVMFLHISAPNHYD